MSNLHESHSLLQRQPEQGVGCSMLSTLATASQQDCTRGSVHGLQDGVFKKAFVFGCKARPAFAPSYHRNPATTRA